MKNILWITILLCLFGITINIHSQEIIELANPSFEDIPRKGAEFSPPIKDWHDCGASLFSDESSPDIHPVPGNAWGVKMEAKDGKTYLSMVVRCNSSFESVSQALKTPLQKDKCYSLSVFLARSSIYRSLTKRSKQELEDFTNPIVLNIWAGNYYCYMKNLIGKSTPVDHEDWIEYKFEFKPDEDYKYITLAADIRIDATEPYNGHIMIDKLSSIVEVECK